MANRAIFYRLTETAFYNACNIFSGCSSVVGPQQCIVSFLSSSANGEFPPVAPISPMQALLTPSNENIKTTTPGPGASTECEF